MFRWLRLNFCIEQYNNQQHNNLFLRNSLPHNIRYATRHSFEIENLSPFSKTHRPPLYAIKMPHNDRRKRFRLNHNNIHWALSTWINWMLSECRTFNNASKRFHVCVCECVLVHRVPNANLWTTTKNQMSNSNEKSDSETIQTATQWWGTNETNNRSRSTAEKR